jgi:hypothetical protein
MQVFVLYPLPYPAPRSEPPRPRAQGEQVFISYGPQGNDSLLQFYGFVEAGNPHDAFRVPGLAARARAAAASLGMDPPLGQAAADAAFTASPAPFAATSLLAPISWAPLQSLCM